MSDAIAAPDGRVGMALKVAVFFEMRGPLAVDIKRMVSASAEIATFPGPVLVEAP